MAYEVLARKWRPQNFAAVVGQNHVTRTLENAIRTNRVAHAYLFVGPRGVGKTSLARILAKALNCQLGVTTEPCDKCPSCLEVMAGNSLDVLEIDGASNNGVEQVRELRDSARYAPARGPFKIYIIDEVHMLSTAAFNALLKTLEEPPPHVKFIFATTEPQKVPATILSRCQRFDLRPIPTPELIAHLAKIAKAEGIDIDDAAMDAVARGADGGLRDAESALDQLIAFRGKTIRETDVTAVFGLIERAKLEELVGAIVNGQVSPILAAITELEAQGKDMQRLLGELINYFRNMLVVCTTGGNDLGLLSGYVGGKLIQYTEKLDGEKIWRLLDVLTETDQRLRYALSKRTLLEVSLIRCARAVKTVTIEEIVGELQRIKASGLPEVKLALPDSCQPDPRPAIPAQPVVAREESPVEQVHAEEPLLDSVPEEVPVAKEEENLPAIEAEPAPVKIELAEEKETSPLATEEEKPVAKKPRGHAKKKWSQEPAVRQVLELFNGDILEIKEGKGN